MGTPRKARNRKYDIDARMKEYLSSMANKAHFNERVAFIQQQASYKKEKLQAGWQRRLLMDLIFPEPVKFASETRISAPKPPQPRTPILLRTLFDRIIEAQGGVCYLCLADLDGDATRDHVVPVARGGCNERNILAAHRKCNEFKADREPFAYELERLETVYAKLDGNQTRSRSRRAKPSYENEAFA